MHSNNIELLNEMEMFNIKRREIMSFKDFSNIYDKVTDVHKPNTHKTLKPYMHEIKRLDLFGHEAFDPTYDMLDKAKGNKPKSGTNRANGLLYTQTVPTK